MREMGCEYLRKKFCWTQTTRGLYRFQSAWITSGYNLLKLFETFVSGSRLRLSTILIPTAVFPFWYLGRQRYLSAVAKFVEAFRCFRRGG